MTASGRMRTQICVPGMSGEKVAKKTRKETTFNTLPKPRWENVNQEIYMKMSDVLSTFVLEALEDCDWEVKAKAFSDCLSKSAWLATMTTEDVEREKHKTEKETTLLKEKALRYIQIRKLKSELKRKFSEERVKDIKLKYPKNKY